MLAQLQEQFSFLRGEHGQIPCSYSFQTHTHTSDLSYKLAYLRPTTTTTTTTTTATLQYAFRQSDSQGIWVNAI